MSVATQSGLKGDMRSCGVLSVVFKTPKCTSHLGIGLGNLKQLYSLYIYGTQLGGAIPPELGNIRLTELELVNNELSGEIPPWLGNHSDLITLSLGENQLSGEIPAKWGNFQGNRVLTEEDFQQVVFPPAGLEPFALDAHFQAGLVFE